MITLEDTILKFNSFDDLANSVVIYHYYNNKNILFYVQKETFELLLDIKIDINILRSGINLLDILHKDDIDIFSISNPTDQKYKSFHTLFRFLKPNGTYIILKGKFNIFNNHSIENTIVFKTELLDVRDLYKSIEETSVMKRNFQAMMEDTTDFIFFKDANHILTAASDSLARITGYKKGHEIVGKIDYELFPQEHADAYYKLEKEIYNGDIPYIEETQPIKDENGEIGWITNRKSPIKNKKGEIIGLYGIARVVTENVRNKQIIEDQKKILEKAQEIAHLGNWFYDRANDKLAWSEEIYRIFEVDNTNKDLTYEMFLNYIHPDDIDMVEYVNKESLIKKKACEFIHRILLNDGRVKYIQERIEHNFDEDGEVISSFGTALDITNLKEYENEIKQKDEILIAQSRNAAMGEMISMIAHQWRQPLSVITMNVNNILLDIELDSLDLKSTTEYLNSVLDQSTHLSQTIDDFRNYFSPTENKEQESIQTIIKDTKDVVEMSLKYNSINLIVQNNDDVTLNIHKRELMQVLLNLISNSKDAFIVNNIEKREITISIEENEFFLIVHLCDNAGGIAQEILNDIFNPYFTTKSNLNGTGLGLYMSKMIIEKHMKGQLLVKNYKDGVCFTINLPKDKSLENL